MNVLLALSLIFIFYYLFVLNDKLGTKEHFQGETDKILEDIKIYFSKRINEGNQGGTIDDLKNIIGAESVTLDNFTEPLVVNKSVETNETKIMSDSPVFIPTNLYVNGTFKINNKDTDSTLSKNLCMGNNCYSEQDILYIIQDLLPYYKYTSSGESDIKELCFENYETLNSVFELPPLEVLPVREGLDYPGQLISLREIVREYDFDLSDTNIDKNLVLANSLRTDYNVINFIEKYPSILPLFLEYTGVSENTTEFINNFRNETIEKYNNTRETVNVKVDKITRDNCINGEHLRILKGETPIKLTTEDERIKQKTKLNGSENWHTNVIDGMRKWYTANNRLRRDYAGEKGVQMYADPDIYYDKSIKLSENEMTELPYLNEQHFEVHGINDDDNDCMNYKKLKIATMSKSKKGDELQRNGSFNIEVATGKEGETGVFCKPE